MVGLSEARWVSLPLLGLPALPQLVVEGPSLLQFPVVGQSKRCVSWGAFGEALNELLS